MSSLDDATLSGLAQRVRTAGFDAAMLAQAERIALTAALGADLVSTPQNRHVLEDDGVGLRSRMRLMPFGGLLLASDQARS